MTWTQIIWYFLIYSVIGWCVEVVYAAVTHGRIENRGFLDGPVCPIYGFGMVFISGIIYAAGYENIEDCPSLVLFFGGMIIATGIDLIAGWALMKLFHMRWWDYSKMPFNLGGYICPKFSIYWGIAGLLTVKLVHIPLTNLIDSAIFRRYSLPVMVVCATVYIIDVVGTVKNVIGINKSIKQFEEINEKLHKLSDNLSGEIGERTLKLEQKIEEGMDEREKKLGNYEKELERIFQRFNGNRFFGVRRIMHEQNRNNHHKVRRIWEWHVGRMSRRKLYRN